MAFNLSYLILGRSILFAFQRETDDCSLSTRGWSEWLWKVGEVWKSSLLIFVFAVLRVMSAVILWDITFDVAVCDISSGVVQLGQYFIPSLGEVNRYFRGWARGSVNQVTNQSVKEVWSLLPFLQQRKDKKGSSVTLYPIRNLSNLCELVLTKVPSSAYLKDLFIISFQN